MGGTPGSCMAFGMALETLSLPCTLFIRHLAGKAGITHNVLAFPTSCHSSENLQWGGMKVPFKRGLPSFLKASEPSLRNPEVLHPRYKFKPVKTCLPTCHDIPASSFENYKGFPTENTQG